LPRTEALEAEPEWLAEVCGAVVSLYNSRAPRLARRDVYARHLNVLVYIPASVIAQRRLGFGQGAASLAHSMSVSKHWWPMARWPAST
jgi:hypothetical protein